MDITICMLGGIPFYIADYILTKMKINSPYYILHVIHNMIVVYLTWEDMKKTYTDFHNLEEYGVNYSVPALVVSFHIYHMIKYVKKMRYIDWLHHILMIGVAIPIGLVATEKTTLMSNSLFWSTGLPGSISYFFLFLNRNGIISQIMEKKINTWMNVWIRSPGCVSVLILSLVQLGSSKEEMRWIGILPAILMYWNGQYFMNQTVEDYTIRRQERITESV